MGDTRLTLTDIGVTLSGTPILSDISLEFAGGTLTALIGRNGAGKSTLLRSILGLTHHTGSVRLTEEGETLSTRRIAYLPQLASETSRLTVFETVLLGLSSQLTWKVSPEQAERVSSTLASLRMTQFASRRICDLSGGQRQLVFLAQAFVSSPRVLLLDEPTSALDIRHQLIVMQAARDYCLRTGAVGICVIHDLMLASRYSDRIVLLHKRRVLNDGTPQQVLTSQTIDPVYGIESLIERNSAGHMTMMPLRPL